MEIDTNIKYKSEIVFDEELGMCILLGGNDEKIPIKDFCEYLQILEGYKFDFEIIDD